MAPSGLLESAAGQAMAALVWASFWAAFVENVRPRMERHVRASQWWPRALPSQINVMVNFGYTSGETTEDMAAYGYVWIITMCITHITSAVLMLPAVALGWDAAGATGRLLFVLGTLSEIGFDIFDGIKALLLTFFSSSFPKLGPPCSLKVFVVIVLGHHATAMMMIGPMNLRYPTLPAYHQITFALLCSAGVCFLAGQYTFTLDSRTRAGLSATKRIVVLQFVVNLLTRVLLWFPLTFSLLRVMQRNGDSVFFACAAAGVAGMTLYNLLIVADAVQNLVKWLPQTVSEGDVDDKKAS